MIEVISTPKAFELHFKEFLTLPWEVTTYRLIGTAAVALEIIVI
jgi:hypothetical protein